MPSKVVAIHQPNFFPWLGYFNKIARADLFVLMDNAQFPKTGGTWINRVRMIVNGQPAWTTAPIDRSYHGVRRVDEMLIDNSAPWRAKLLKTIQMSYSRAPFFQAVFPALADLVNNPAERLAEYNICAVRALMAQLGLDLSRLVLGSTLDAEGNATDLLIAMVKAVGGTAYLCGGGASGYQDDEKFAAAGIDLIYQNFQHPVYAQAHAKEFIPGLSIVDTLMNCGFEHTRALISASR